jgi:uncharacterized protein (TIGR02646 family)
VLQNYAWGHPDATWEQMQGDNADNGSQTASACRAQAVQDQHGLCAYCEQKIVADNPLHCRVEHFHPKSDTAETRNWSLDWNNMLAVCDGGSVTSQEERISHPLPENLSCDAHKDRMIQMGKLPVSCEGHLLNPLDVPDFPNLFAFDKGSGHLEAETTTCCATAMPENSYSSTVELVMNTISALNLNCERLAEKRRMLVVNMDKNKKTLRQKGISPADMPEKLVDRYFSGQWPEFFTTLRCCLGSAAEKYLQNIQSQGGGGS